MMIALHLLSIVLALIIDQLIGDPRWYAASGERVRQDDQPAGTGIEQRKL